MADQIDKSNRYSLELNGNEIHFLQHCIVYVGSCVTNNEEGAEASFNIIMKALVHRVVSPDDLQKRLLSLAGIDVSKIDDAHEGITWINDDGSMDKQNLADKTIQ